MTSRSTKYRMVAVSMLAATVVLGGACGSAKTSADKTTADKASAGSTTEAYARLDPAAFADRLQDKDAVVINVHIPYEGELDQTDVFIPYDKILDDSHLPKDKDSEILLYCRSGRMSEEAGAALHNAGYTNVSHLEGGMKGWETAGRKLIHDPAHAAETPAEMPQHG